MTKTDGGCLLGLYRRSKVKFNHLLYRIISRCDMVLMDAYRFPWPAAQSTAKEIARLVGNTSWLVRALPRLSAYRLVGGEWTIIFVGGDPGLRRLRHLFSAEEEAEQQELGRIALWKLSGQTQQWLTEGVDLVVCELGRMHPHRPEAPLAFSVPTWVHQVLPIPDPLEKLLSGKRFSKLRYKINRGRRIGFDYRFSRCRADFDHFRHRMYLPYVRSRHGELALVASYQDQWHHAFSRGGILLVTREGKPVAGELSYVANGTCFCIERGVLDADPQLYREDVETMLTWYGVTYGRSQGSSFYDMGSTSAWRSDGSFKSKRRWGAQVIRARRIHGTWVFLAQNLPASLRDHINLLGPICEMDGKLWGVMLTADTGPEDDSLREEVVTAQKDGLAGLAVVSPDTDTVVYDSVG